MKISEKRVHMARARGHIGSDYIITLLPQDDSMDIWSKDGQWLHRRPVLYNDAIC